MRVINPSTLNGTITIRPSKSVLHRLAICAALSQGVSQISNYKASLDVTATLNAVRDMGFCTYEIADDRCVITGGLQNITKPVIDCGESGSTLRFLLPLACDGQERFFKGHGRLPERPMQPYEHIFAANQVFFQAMQDGFSICGELAPGTFELDGSISSQFVTGLLFKLPLMNGDSRIVIQNKLESLPYIDITRHCQDTFGVHTNYMNKVFSVHGNQVYNAANIAAEGDYSHAAFFAVGAALSGKVQFTGLQANSTQGDRQIFDILKIMGADVQWEGSQLIVEERSLQPIEVDVSQIPDLVPALAVAACAAEGKSKLINAARLRFKESDRLDAMAVELERLGADIVQYEDSLVINGKGYLDGGHVHTHNDHRIAMALTVASCISKEKIVLDEPDVVRKSAPEFFEEFRRLGGKID